MALTPDFRAWPGTPGAAASTAALDAGLRSYMLHVYNWMVSGLLVTGGVAYAIAYTGLRTAFYQVVPTINGYAERPTMLGVVSMFAPLAFVLVLSFGVNRLSRAAAQALFWAFCAAMGASLSAIFLIYTGESIVRVFFITAGTFAAVSIYGYTTKADLTNIGSFLFMGLIGIIIAGLVNLFLHSSQMQFIISILAVLIFTGLTAFDTQRIKADYLQFAGGAGVEEAGKRSVYAALSLYLDFINLFQNLLYLFGNRR